MTHASSTPTLDLEREASAAGARVVAGVDEVGRGALGGPVVAAAVVLCLGEPGLERRLAGVRDSKALLPSEREALASLIREAASCVAVGRAEAREIDALGIGRATELAMRRALARIWPAPSMVLVDGLPLRACPWPHRGVVRGDRQVMSIAAASIVAKVARDAEMIELGLAGPDGSGWGWEHHKGYGTPEHLDALQRLGPSRHHRLTWAPVAAVCRHHR